MKTYYVQYDVWRNDDIVPIVEKARIEASSREEAISKIQQSNVGSRIATRLIHSVDDDLPPKKPRRSIGLRLGFLLIGCIGLFIVIGRSFNGLF